MPPFSDKALTRDDMQNNALYYPLTALRDASLVKALALFYDRVYRIVPDNVRPDDHEELRPLLEEGCGSWTLDREKPRPPICGPTRSNGLDGEPPILLFDFGATITSRNPSTHPES
jgi:hypothetical protein